MIDIQVIKIRDLLPVRRVMLAEAGDPPTLVLEGADFSSAQDVYVNEVRSPSVIVVDDRTIMAQVPDSANSSAIRSVSVVSGRFTRAERSKVEFMLGSHVDRVSGLQRLVQLFLKIMLQTPNTDIFNKDSGGGLLKSVGKLVSKTQTTSLVADFNLSVSRARSQILQMQANNPPTDLSERLLYARPLSASFSAQEQALVGKIDIANQAGKSAVLGLVT